MNHLNLITDPIEIFVIASCVWGFVITVGIVLGGVLADKYATKKESSDES